jgi:hypothetical protein
MSNGPPTPPLTAADEATAVEPIQTDVPSTAEEPTAPLASTDPSQQPTNQSQIDCNQLAFPSIAELAAQNDYLGLIKAAERVENQVRTNLISKLKETDMISHA